MTDIKSAVQGAILKEENDSQNITDETKSTPETKSDGDLQSIKRRRGKPPKIHKLTKLHVILEKRGMTRKDLYKLIEDKYPEEPISPDAVSRIVSGNRKYYNTRTLYRICGALGITPNMALNWEEETK